MFPIIMHEFYCLLDLPLWSVLRQKSFLLTTLPEQYPHRNSLVFLIKPLHVEAYRIFFRQVNVVSGKFWSSAITERMVNWLPTDYLSIIRWFQWCYWRHQAMSKISYVWYIMWWQEIRKFGIFYIILFHYLVLEVSEISSIFFSCCCFCLCWLFCL